MKEHEKKDAVEAWKAMSPDLVPTTLAPSQAMLELIKCRRSGLIVDLGGGSGALAVDVAEHCGTAAIVDCNASLLLRGRILHPQAGLFWINADARLCPLRDSCCDLVIMQGLLTTMPDADSQEQMAQESARVLKRGGHLYVSDFLVSNHLDYYARRYKRGASGVFEVHDPRGKWLYNAKHWSADELVDLFLENFTTHMLSKRKVRTRSGNIANGIELIMVRR